ncbi:PIG-L family deacetylase [Embleya sp. NBC_00896]|uniref:PIG-L family deacetylase n=1 Tax=Embleya sp. NBC_00896 TaxID=2975961 RepID=UPI0038706091|nr:PIG-L family deacetylase [Embleya sp. NBC_00896]
MQILAHPDDDLYFMNPELLEGIRAGGSSTSVYLTAGEIQDPLLLRQQGIMAAYAAMAEKWGSSWTGSSITVANAKAEVYTLDDRPDIRVVFLNLPDDACLQPLAQNPAGSCITKNPASPGTGVNATYVYRPEDLSEALYQLLREYRPAGVRILDANPDIRNQSDHRDHISAAIFANRAIGRYSATETSRIFVAAFQGYGTANAPDNLAEDDLYNKLAASGEYESIATNAQGTQAWRRPQYERWSRGSNWIGRNTDGGLQAFAVVGEKVLTWRQSANGTWSAAQQLPSPGGPLAPGLSVGNNPDGRLQVVGRRLDNDAIMTIHQTAVNGNFAASWSNFGNPNDLVDTTKRTQVGTPLMVRNADGLLQIFVKNGAGRVGTVYQSNPSNGAWDLGWKDIGGLGVQDGLSAVVNGVGRIELFGWTLNSGRVGKLATWYQGDTKGQFSHNPFLVASNVASAPTAMVAANGRVRVFYRTSGTGSVSVLNQLNVAGAWQQTTSSTGDQGGTRRPEVARGSDGRLLLYARNDNSGLSLNWQTSPTGGYAGWGRFASLVIDSPAIVTRGDGRLSLFHIGANGLLYVAEQSAGAPDAAFADWNSIS